MSNDIALLEQAWLKAETTVDEMKQAARTATAELAKMRQARGENGDEFSVLVAMIEQLETRQQEAEQTASAAFDRYWMAQGETKDSGSAYA